MYELSLTVNGVLYESKGETMQEAIANLPKPPKTTAKGVMTIRNGEKSKTMLMMPNRLKRLWMKFSPVYLGKYYELLLK